MALLLRAPKQVQYVRLSRDLQVTNFQLNLESNRGLKFELNLESNHRVPVDIHLVCTS